MKLRKLEMMLEKVSGFTHPSPEREQYQTPAPLAARLLYTAFLAGDIHGLRVLDLGSGTGILAIGAALLGAAEVIGVEIDADANLIAAENARALGVSLEIIEADIAKNSKDIIHADTIIMNPPFGAQVTHADRPFIDAALKGSQVIYGIFNAGSEEFVRHYISKRAEITAVIAADFTIPKTFFFHKDAKRDVPVEIIVIKRV